MHLQIHKDYAPMLLICGLRPITMPMRNARASVYFPFQTSKNLTMSRLGPAARGDLEMGLTLGMKQNTTPILWVDKTLN